MIPEPSPTVVWMRTTAGPTACATAAAGSATSPLIGGAAVVPELALVGRSTLVGAVTAAGGSSSVALTPMTAPSSPARSATIASTPANAPRRPRGDSPEALDGGGGVPVDPADDQAYDG